MWRRLARLPTIIRRWGAAVKGLAEQGVTPLGVETPESYLVSACGFLVPKGESWIETATELCALEPGKHLILA